MGIPAVDGQWQDPLQLSRTRSHPTSPELRFASSDCKPSKRFRLTPIEVATNAVAHANKDACDGKSSLELLLKSELPDKEAFISDWLTALAATSVCIHSLEDVKRISAEDIASLPVPPLVRRLFRDIITKEAKKEK